MKNKGGEDFFLILFYMMNDDDVRCLLFIMRVVGPHNSFASHRTAFLFAICFRLGGDEKVKIYFLKGYIITLETNNAQL